MENNIISTPRSFIEELIKDTWGDKIFWGLEDEFETGKRYSTYISIPNTSKKLEIKFFDLGANSFIKTSFFSTKKIEFENINGTYYREVIARLNRAIKEKLKRKENYIS